MREVRVKVAETVADGGDPFYTAVFAENPYKEGHYDDSRKLTGESFGDLGGEDDDEEGDDAYGEDCEVDGVEISEVDTPFADEVAGDFLRDRETEKVGHLCGEDGDSDTGCETDDDGVWNEFDDSSEFEESHQEEYATCHECGYGESGEAVELYDIIYDNNECSCWTADLDSVTAACRDDEAADDGCDETHCGGNTGGDGESDGEREGNDADYDAGDAIRAEFLKGVMAQGRDNSGLKVRTRKKFHL